MYYKLKEDTNIGVARLCSDPYVCNLSDQELLEEIIPRETASKLLAEYSSIYEIIMNNSFYELEKLAGLNRQNVVMLSYIKEILKRFHKSAGYKIKSITSGLDAFYLMNDMQYLKQEQFRVVLLDVKHKIISNQIITQGTVSGTLVGAREVFNPAIKHMASKILLVHNHPSGDPTPSREDIEITKQLVKAGDIIGIPVLDHIIIGKDEYTSLKNMGHL